VENDTTGFTFIITGPEYSKTVTVSESSSPLVLHDLYPGTYTVVEQATPSYYTIEGSNTQTVIIGGGSFTNEQGIWNQTVTFTNNYSYTPPRHRDPVIQEEPTPTGPVVEIPEVIIDEPVVPAAPLPKTGGLDPGFLYGLGALLATGGLVIRKRKAK
jgi:LPXTG-motif cell wall-anchored protein